jgi:chromosome segregation ATPase
MENNEYVNHYIEIMTGTLTDAVLRNISLQANAKVTESVLENQARVIEELQGTVEQHNAGNNAQVDNLKNDVSNLEKTILNLRNELTTVNNLKNEYESVKHQTQHVDTFRNELAKEREEHQRTKEGFDSQKTEISQNYEKQIAELNEQIEYLQLTPAKRKKVDEAKAISLGGSTIDVTTLVDATTKDGGSF